MIDLSYDFITGLFDGVFENPKFTWFNYSYKFLAVSFFLLNFYSNMLTSQLDWGTTKAPFNTTKLLNSLLVVLMIAFYDKILGSLDAILQPIDQGIQKYTPLMHDLSQDEISETDGDIGVFPYLKKAAAEVRNVIRNPFLLILKMAYGIFWILDNLVYGLFLIERFFYLTILKIIGPIIFCISIFEKFRDLMIKWFKLYAAYYLLIIPYFLVIFITNEMYAQLSIKIEQSVLVKTLPTYEFMALSVVTGLSFFLKFRLFKKSTDVVYKIFG